MRLPVMPCRRGRTRASSRATPFLQQICPRPESGTRSRAASPSRDHLIFSGHEGHRVGAGTSATQTSDDRATGTLNSILKQAGLKK